MNLETLQAFHLDSEEHMVLKFRKHWFVFLINAIGTALAVFLLPLIFIAAALLFPSLGRAAVPIMSFATFWWLLIVWLTLSIIWTNYYLDLWVITDKRIVSIDQTALFSRVVTTFPFINIQDVTIEQRGLLQTFLDFGTVTVQTAGPTTNNMVIVGVARPQAVRDTIVQEAEGWRRRNGPHP